MTSNGFLFCEQFDDDDEAFNLQRLPLSGTLFHSKVQTNGGVLSRDDISNYSVEVGQPLEGLYNGKDKAFCSNRLPERVRILDTFIDILLILS